MSRRIRVMALVASAAILLAAFLWWCSPLLFRLAGATSDGVLYRVPGADSAVALTIDDAPRPGTTDEILRVLERHGARATFFVIGSRARRHPDLVRAIRRGGHEIGHHMWRDRRSLALDSASFRRALLRTDSTLARFGDQRWLRPGGGLYSDRMVRAARRHGHRIALGDVYPLDPVVRWPAPVTRFVLAWVRPGSVIILHDGEGRGERTAEVLRRVLPELRERGLDVVSLGDLVERGKGAAR